MFVYQFVWQVKRYREGTYRNSSNKQVVGGIVLMQRNMKVQKLSVQFQQPGIKATVVSFKQTAHGIRSLLHNQQTILCKLIFKPAYVHTTDNTRSHLHLLCQFSVATLRSNSLGVHSLDCCSACKVTYSL